jgi:hypothetical protein
MGLDMYLNARRFIWSYDGSKDGQTGREIAERFPELGDDATIKYVIAEVAYWRKANAIHQWFVDNVQNGVDDCGDYYVERGHLEDLLKLVNAVLNKEMKPEDALPTQSGFFFGNTEYTEWYFDDLQSTKEQLEKILSNEELFKKWDIYYHASW